MSSLRLVAFAAPLFFVVAACSGTGLVSVGTDRSGDTGGDGGDTTSSSSSGGAGSSSGGSSGSNGKPCAADSDCGTNALCGFEKSLACSATGSCFDVPAGTATCAAYSAGCACDGTEINVACSPLPDGYASKPLAHAGSCSGSTGLPCTTSSDCGGGALCGYATADACAATGTCFAITGGAMCNAATPGCACDGTTINIICTGLPDGYTTKALAHTGACN